MFMALQLVGLIFTVSDNRSRNDIIIIRLHHGTTVNTSQLYLLCRVLCYLQPLTV